MTKPKRHHFLPEFYLRGFARDGLVWLYDREKIQYRRQPPHNTAVIGHYYAVEGTSGETYYGIEKLLSQVESKARPVIAKLEEGLVVTPEERLYFAHFIALLLTRTPKFEREMEQIADSTVKLLMKHMFPSVEATAEQLHRAGRDSGVTPENFFEFIHEERYKLKGNRNIAVEAMLEQTEKMTMQLACMDWMIAHADERVSFITTDAPLGFIVPDELRVSSEPVLGLVSDKVTKLIPLTQRITLLIGWPGLGFGHCRVNREQVREINIAVAKECERYVIGHDEDLVRIIVRRSKVDKATPGTRIKVEHVSHPTDPMRTYLVARRVPADAPDEPLKIVVEK